MHILLRGAVTVAIVAAATMPALARNLEITLENASKYNMHYESSSGTTDEYPEEIEKGDSGDITTTHKNGTGSGSIKFTVGEVSSTDETTYCTVDFSLIFYQMTGVTDLCMEVTIEKSTDRSTCTLTKTKSATDDGCHHYYTFDTD